MTAVSIAVAVFALSIALLIIRALLFTPLPQEPAEEMPLEIDNERAAESLAKMVRCKTVSSKNSKLTDPTQFEAFRKLLAERYPELHRTCSLERIGENGLLYRWEGRSDGEPTVLMSHYDVVPAEEESWAKPPFAGIMEEGVLWGRGTLDTKGTLCGIMEAVETHISRGFIPENDIYLSFGGDEEIAGKDTPAIVSELEKRGVRPALVVDEGGAVVEGVFPGIEGPCALVGTGEKGFLDMEFSMQSSGGHASAPPPHTLLGSLSQAAVAIEKHPFPFRLTKPVKEMFSTLGRHTSLPARIIFANLRIFSPLINFACKKRGGELNALVRTSCAFTMAEGSKATNVLPSSAKMVANLRLMGGETTEFAEEYLRKVIGNPDITLRKLYGNDPSPFSDTSSEGWKRLSRAIHRTWPGAIVSPYLMIACSDSRHYCRISDKVMRFSAMAFSKEERETIHGHNERIPIEKIVTTVKFYMRLIAES
ncbi:MAG: M20/M25/M40 family metallo-hydrolase [Spirochaetaceae bacterium]